MMKTTLLVLVASLWAASIYADVVPFPSTFAVKDIDTNGATIHTRIGGKGPAVLMLHGFGESGDMWEPLAVAHAS